MSEDAPEVDDLSDDMRAYLVRAAATLKARREAEGVEERSS